jgi:serine/threonine-protein kinase
VTVQLQRILQSPLFTKTEKVSRLLEYVVKETLAGHASQIKEFVLGVEVYKRRDDYDPKTDAIVRVEAGRLRTKLEQYYALEGQADPIHIELPKGTYVPVFSVRRPTADPQLAPSRIGQAALLLTLSFVVCAFLFARLSSGVIPHQGLFAVAILPTSNLTGNPTLDGFCQSTGEHITAKLTARPGLLVRSGRAIAPSNNDGAVDAILQTSVQGSGGTIRLTAQLTNMADNSYLWSQSFTAESPDSARFQDVATDLLIRTLWSNFASLSGDELRRGRNPRPEAVRLLVKGQTAWLTQRDALTAVTLFQQAVAMDKEYGEAYAGLATAAWFLADFEAGGYVRRLTQARAAVARALALNDRLAEAHSTLGNILLFEDKKWTEAERELRRSVELMPGNSFNTRWYTLAASLRGHQKRAAEELEFARLINPSSPEIQEESGRVALEQGQLTDAETYARQALALSPRFRLARYLLGRIHERKGEHAEAIASYRACGKALEWDIDCQAALASVLALSGDRAAAERAAAQTPTWTGRALVALRLGRPEEAIVALKHAASHHDRDFALAWYDDRFAQARQDTRFSQIWQQSGLSIFQ